MRLKYIVVGYSSLTEQNKFIHYIKMKTGKVLNLGPIEYDGKCSILLMNNDLSNIRHTNVTCAVACPGYKFHSVDEFIAWYEKEGSVIAKKQPKQLPKPNQVFLVKEK